MTRVRSESGAINILNVIIMLVLLIALGFAFELSAALDQQNAQTNGLLRSQGRHHGVAEPPCREELR